MSRRICVIHPFWRDLYTGLREAMEEAYQAGLDGTDGFPWAVEANVRCDLRELRRQGGRASDLEEAALRRQYQEINEAYLAGCRERVGREAA